MIKDNKIIPKARHDNLYKAWTFTIEKTCNKYCSETQFCQGEVTIHRKRAIVGAKLLR